MDIGDGVALALAFAQGLRARDVEIGLGERLDQMPGERAVDGIIARRIGLEEGRTVLDVPLRQVRIGRVLGVTVADGVAVIDREGRPAVFQIALVLVVAEYDQRIERGGADRLAQALHRGARDVLARDEVLRRDHVRELRIGGFEEIAIGDLAAFEVAVLHLLVGLDEPRQRLVGCEQHRRMRGAGSEHDPGHACLRDARVTLALSVRLL